MNEENLKQGMILFRPAFSDYLHIFRIETHYKNAEGKRIKYPISNRIIHIEYLLNYKPPFTTYSKEVIRMLSFNNWIISHEI